MRRAGLEACPGNWGVKTAESLCPEVGKLSRGTAGPGHEQGPPGQKGRAATAEERPQEGEQVRGAGLTRRVEAKWRGQRGFYPEG